MAWGSEAVGRPGGKAKKTPVVAVNNEWAGQEQWEVISSRMYMAWSECVNNNNNERLYSTSPQLKPLYDLDK
jgi:hypothetical protein